MRSATPHISGVFDENSIDFKLQSGNTSSNPQNKNIEII
jgi:hypothetical protein